jgi:murein DD-endopeptidase MepM/ murein hydrolase activator NlpD
MLTTAGFTRVCMAVAAAMAFALGLVVLGASANANTPGIAESSPVTVSPSREAARPSPVAASTPSVAGRPSPEAASGETSPQSFSVSPLARTIPVTRDAYTITPPPLRWPVDRSSPLGSVYGDRPAPCEGCSSFHTGADFDAGNGAAVHAIAAGSVVETDDPAMTTFGVHVAIHHVIAGQVVVSFYGHLQGGSMTLRVGDPVVGGQQIARVGMTGVTTGPHLHFELRPGGTTPVNPLPWMEARLGERR